MKLNKLIVIIAIVAIMGSFASCVTATGIGASSGGHGLFTGGGAGRIVTEGAVEIASYTVILGLVDSGYEQFAAAVKAAELEGKQITYKQTFYFVLVKTTAYAR